MIIQPAQEEGVCDKCGGELYQRDDDTEATVRNRLAVYRKQTEPLIEYYDRAGVVARIDGAQAPDRSTRTSGPRWAGGRVRARTRSCGATES